MSMVLDNGDGYRIDYDRLSQDVRFPEDCIHILRSRPFRFAARSCNEWFRDRVALCGDAAHVFPPCTLPYLPHTSIRHLIKTNIPLLHQLVAKA